MTVANNDAESTGFSNEGLTEQLQDSISPERGNTYADATNPQEKSLPKKTEQGAQANQGYSTSNSDATTPCYGTFYAAFTSPAWHHSQRSFGTSSSSTSSNNFEAGQSGSFAGPVHDKASEKDTVTYVSLIDLGSAFGQLGELNAIRKKGNDASHAELAKLQAFKSQLTALGYRLADDDSFDRTPTVETSFEPKGTVLSIALGHIQDHAGHKLYVSAIPGLGQGSEVESVEIKGMLGSESMFWGVDQASAETYLVTWRSGDGHFLMTQGSAASIQAIVGKATYTALADGQRVVPGNEQLVAEAKRLMAQVQSGDGHSSFFMTFMESLQVHCLGFVQGVYNGVSQAVFGILNLAALLSNVGPYVVSGQVFEDIGRKASDIKAAFDEVSQLSDKEFALARQELVAKGKAQAQAELEYLWHETKRLAYDPVKLGEVTFDAATLLVGVGELGALRSSGVLSKAGMKGLGKNKRLFNGLEVRAVRDLSHLDESTLRAMQQYGFSGKTAKGEKIVLHHLGQNSNGPIVEIPLSKHKMSNKVQHPHGNRLGVGLSDQERLAFNQWRIEYWKAREKEEIQRRK